VVTGAGMSSRRWVREVECRQRYEDLYHTAAWLGECAMPPIVVQLPSGVYSAPCITGGQTTRPMSRAGRWGQLSCGDAPYARSGQRAGAVGSVDGLQQLVWRSHAREL